MALAVQIVGLFASRAALAVISVQICSVDFKTVGPKGGARCARALSLIGVRMLESLAVDKRLAERCLSDADC